jgi:hypothetical protein
MASALALAAASSAGLASFADGDQDVAGAALFRRGEAALFLL